MHRAHHENVTVHRAGEVLTQFTLEQNQSPLEESKRMLEIFIWESLEETEHTSTDQVPTCSFL